MKIVEQEREPEREIILRPLIPLLGAFMAGIIAGTLIPGHHLPAYTAAAMAAGVVCWGVAKGYGAFLSPFVLFSMLGYLSIQYWVAPSVPANHISHFTDGNRYSVSGTILGRPMTKGPRTTFVLEAEVLKGKTTVHSVAGRIRVSVMGKTPDLSEGDQVRFVARIRSFHNFENPGGFDYRQYMAFRRITGSAWVAGERLAVVKAGTGKAWNRHFRRFRGEILHLIETVSDGRPRAVLKALLLGERDDITPSLRNAFNRAGIGHLLAISGLHIGIVAAVAFAVFKWTLSRFSFFLWRAWTRKGAALLTLVPVLIYGLLSGMSPSTQRAVIMAVVFLMTFLVEREHDPATTLALAALVIVVVDPPAVFSISFQLSFMAVLSILYGLSRIPAPAVGDSGFKSRLLRKMVIFFLVSLFAILGTLPPVMFYFNQVSLVGLLTNCIFIPAIGFGVVPIGLLAVFVQPFSHTLAGVILKASAVLLENLLDWVHFFADLPYAAVKTVTPDIVEIGCFYGLAWAVLHLAGNLVNRNESRSGRRHSAQLTAKSVAVLSMLVFAVDVGYWTFQRYYLPDLRVTMIDVGQGSSALLELPEGQTVLIDGGGFSDNSTFDMGARVVAPFLWRKKIRTVDTVVLSHPNSDHLNGLLFILEHFNVKNVWANGERSNTDGYGRFLEIVKNKKIRMLPFHMLSREHSLNGVHLKILYPPRNFLSRKETESWRKSNNNSLVVKAGFRSVSFLFTGDIMAPAESELVRMSGVALKSTVLMAPHHGSRTSSTTAFLSRVAPEIVAVSAGWKNRYRFPHPHVIERYLQRDCRIFRTDQQGAVTFRTDGKTLEVRTEVGDPGWWLVK